DALEAMVGMQTELRRLLTERAATPEEARRANAELRATMRDQDNYFPELEGHARELLEAVGHPGGPLSQRGTAEIANHLGFSLHTSTTCRTPPARSRTWRTTGCTCRTGTRPRTTPDP